MICQNYGHFNSEKRACIGLKSIFLNFYMLLFTFQNKHETRENTVDNKR